MPFSYDAQRNMFVGVSTDSEPTATHDFVGVGTKLLQADTGTTRIWNGTSWQSANDERERLDDIKDAILAINRSELIAQAAASSDVQLRQGPLRLKQMRNESGASATVVLKDGTGDVKPTIVIQDDEVIDMQDMEFANELIANCTTAGTLNLILWISDDA